MRFHVTSPKKIIINNGGFIISVMDDPMQNTEAEPEDGIKDRNNDLQGPSNSRTIVKFVETVHSGSRDSINGEKEKIKEKGGQNQKVSSSPCQSSSSPPNQITMKKILLFRKKLESSPSLKKAAESYQKIQLTMATNLFSCIFLKAIWKKM